METNWFKKTLLSVTTATALGLSGHSQAVVTAILDTGIDTGTLEDVKVGGFDFVDGDADTNDTSPTAHGTFMGLIFNATSPAEQIMPLRTYTGAPGTSTSMSLGIGNAAIDFATANPAVKVISINRLQPMELGRLQAAVQADKVIVINSGNAAAATAQGSATLVPALFGGGLIVTGHDTDGTISETVNRIGAPFAQHGIAALFNTSGTSIRGSSFAMARVAAAAAAVKSRDPQLTPRQVVDILKRSADDAGVPGVDAVFGHGLLNRTAALQAVGTTSVGGNGSSSSSSGAAAGGALVVGAGLYALFNRNKKLKKTLILDEFGRSFWMDMTQATTHRDQTPSLDLVMATLDRKRDTFMVSGSENHATYASITRSGGQLAPILELETLDTIKQQSAMENVAYSFHNVDRSGRRMSFGINEGQSSYFGALSMLERNQRVDFLNNRLMMAPLSGFTDKGLNSAMMFGVGDNIKVKFGLSSNDDQHRWGLASDSAFFETSYETERWGLSMQLGELREKGSLFGGSSNGAFSVDSARTLSLGMAGHYQLGTSTSLIGSYQVGFTDVKDRKQSLLSNFSTLKSNSYGAGLVSTDVFKRGDRFGMAYFQPLRVTDGAVDASVPYARDIPGNIYTHDGRYSLASVGSESIVEFYYGMGVGKGVEFGSHLLYRDEPGHDVNADRERVVMFTLNRAF